MMLQLLTPGNLLWLSGLLIPVAIHLLSRRKSARVKVGSVRFLEPTGSRKLHSIRLTDLPLLLLRCLLLTVVVLMLTEPVWLTGPEGSKGTEQKGWILIDPEIAGAVPEIQWDATIDSLLSTGHELRWLYRGFAQFEPGQEIHPEDPVSNTWSLLAEASDLAPPGRPFWVLTPAYVHSFRGQRPVLPRPVQWFTVATDTASNRWFESVTPLANDSLLLVLGVSDERSTFFRRYTVSKPQESGFISARDLPAIEFRPGATADRFNLFFVAGDVLANDDSLVYNGTPMPTRAVIYYEEQRADDASYVYAALSAVREYTGAIAAAEKQAIKPGLALPDYAGMVVWLSGQEIPEAFVTKRLPFPALILTDAGNVPFQDVRTTIDTGNIPVAGLRLSRRVPPGGDHAALWFDGLGTPLLELDTLASTRQLRFHSRFHPDWNDLVFSPAFPRLLLTLIEGPGSPSATSRTSLSDRRRISINQLQTGYADPAEEERDESQATPLYFVLWFAAIGLMAAERFMAWRTAGND